MNIYILYSGLSITVIIHFVSQLVLDLDTRSLSLSYI